ncbi:hypothetical protein OVY01_13530 [Robbsia sp. Bb-Pol-6]|uniref:Uncharacterized protein n=1 Tax=Robbsia betulipollinis TaxID=2981849 RepID=A0ABT3ZNY0_9BURK|nr:hypothetical protein [Robbsia betulipollinis]MCY0388240.1 hypothetical protein [Robbsia betulipollinis]
MAKQPTNFLEIPCHSFSDRVLNGKAKETEPLFRALIRAQAIARGAAVVARMQNANTAQGDYFKSEDGEGVEAPVSGYSMEALMGLVAVACETLDNEIDDLAGWAEKNVAPEPAAVAPIKRGPAAKVAA